MKLFTAVMMILLSLGVSTGVRAQEKNEIMVSAALSLKAAFEEIGPLFEKSMPGTRVLFNFAASGVLQRQIESGAPVDVFASASSTEMDVLGRKGMLQKETRRVLAQNNIVLIRNAVGGPAIHTFADLAKPEIKRIAIGNPATVPAGKYSAEALRYYHVDDKVRDRLVLCENVKQVLDYVARGEADAGLVFLTDAKGRSRDVSLVASAAPESHSPAIYEIAVTAGVRMPDAARAFVVFTSSKEAQAALSRQGFRTTM